MASHNKPVGEMTALEKVFIGYYDCEVAKELIEKCNKVEK